MLLDKSANRVISNEMTHRFKVSRFMKKLPTSPELEGAWPPMKALKCLHGLVTESVCAGEIRGERSENMHSVVHNEH